MRWKGFIGLVFALALIATLLATHERDRVPARPGEAEPDSPTLRTAPPESPEAVEVPAGWRMMRGIVLDAETVAPVAGARIVFSGPGGDLVTATDARGEWSLPLPRRSSDYAWGGVEAAGYLVDCVDVREIFGERLLWAAEPVFLVKASVALSGTVIGPDGRPLAKARVEVSCAEQTSRTDAAGRFGPLPAAAGWIVRLEIATDDGIVWFESLRIPHEARGPHEVTVRIPTPRYVPGITLDEEGKPLPGVRIRAGWSDDGARLSSGPDGKFRWPLLGAGTYLRAEKAGYVAISDRHELCPGDEIEIRLERAASIEGRVLSADGSSPPRGLRVYCRDAVCPLEPDGAFRLAPVAASRAHLTVEYPVSSERMNPWEWERSVARVDPRLTIGEERTGFTITLPRLFAHEGRVIDARTRKPVPGAGVEHLRTDADGRFVLWLDEEPEEVVGVAVDVEAEGYVPLGTELYPGKPIELRPARIIEVEVVSETGDPLPGAVVRSGGMDYGVTDHDGRCRIQALIGVDVLLTVRPYRRERESIVVHAERSSIRVAIGPRPVRYVVVAVDENGAPIPDAWLEYEYRRIPADAAGRFEVVSTEDTPVLAAPGRRTREIDPEHEPEGGVHEVRLDPSKPARARFLYADGSPVVALQVTGGGKERRTGGDGRVEFLGFAADQRIRMEFSIPGWNLEEAHILAGGPETVVRLPARGEIRVRFDETAAREEPRIHLFRPPDLEDRVPYFLKRRLGEIRLNVPAGRAALCLSIPPGVYRYYPDLSIREGAPVRLDYDFPDFGTIAGTVLGPDGRPLASAGIRLYIPGRRWIGGTDAAGRFSRSSPFLHRTSPGSPVGMIRLLVHHREYAPVLTPAVDLARDQVLEVRLTRGGTLTGRVICEGGRAELRLLTPGALEDPEFSTDGDGEFSPSGRIRAGRHRIEIVNDEGKRWIREVEIENGKETDVTFRLE